MVEAKRQLSPQAWFADCTYLGHGPEWKDRIFRECLNHGAIALIDYDAELGWIFHTLFTRGGGVEKKEIAKRFDRCEARGGGEAGVNRAVIAHIVASGQHPSTQVACGAGRIDIVTATHIIEVESRLNRQHTFEAVGQVLLYRQSFDPSLRPVIAGRWHADTPDLAPYARGLGIEVWFVSDSLQEVRRVQI